MLHTERATHVKSEHVRTDADLKTGVEYAHKTKWIFDARERCTLAAG